MNVTASLLMGIYITFDLLVSELMLVNLITGYLKQVDLQDWQIYLQVEPNWQPRLSWNLVVWSNWKCKLVFSLGGVLVHSQGEGYLTKFNTGRLCPQVQPLYRLTYHFGRKGTTYIYLLLKKGTPFTCLLQKSCSHF